MGVAVRYDRIVTAPEGDRAGAWGPSIVRLAAADAMTITAAGAVAFWEGAAPFGLEGQGKLLGDTLAPDLSTNSLIGVIGDSAPLLIGTGGRGEAGWLRISVNDQIDKPGAYRNNSGTVSLAVDVSRAAGETGALAAACSGDEPTLTLGQREEAAAAVLELPIASGQVLVTGTEYRTADHALSLVSREAGQLVVQRPDGHTIWSNLDAGAPAVPQPAPVTPEPPAAPPAALVPVNPGRPPPLRPLRWSRRRLNNPLRTWQKIRASCLRPSQTRAVRLGRHRPLF